MAQINEHFFDMKENYLFAEIARRVSAYMETHPEKNVIRLGIGDVTLPLPPIVVNAMKTAAGEMGAKETFRGYPSYEGYDFLREAISGYYASYNVAVKAAEIFVSDGAKSDVGNIVDLFGAGNVVLATDPVYPVYVDTNLMSGRKIIYAPCLEEKGFIPLPDPAVHADLIYLCSPNNPTGAAFTTEQLQMWVNYALERKAVILYDAAYEAFITDSSLPRSIFCIEGARQCAIEFCSLSKTAGFTGTRCGYTVIPEQLVQYSRSAGKNVRLRDLWYRRQATKFNGVSYPVQRAAQAVFTPEGQKQIRHNIAYYQQNAKIISDGLAALSVPFVGGVNSPYIWMKCPNAMESWEFFDFLLENAGVVGTPGEGFGDCGKGWFRLTSFGNREQTAEAMRRMQKLLSALR